jgi:hypothetical protein
MPGTNGLTDAEETALRDQCTVFLAGHGPVTAAALLSSIPADTVPDRYGEGGAITTCALRPAQVRDIIAALVATRLTFSQASPPASGGPPLARSGGTPLG